MADRSNIQNAAILFGVVFILVAVAGAIPGITTDYEGLKNFDGEGAKLLGVFGINWLENAAHLLLGVAGIAMASTAARARSYFLGVGVIYIVLWIYGLLIDTNSSANIIGVNDAANWLHFALGVVMLGIGLVLGRAERPAAIAT